MSFYDTLIAPLWRDLGQTATRLGLAIAAVGAGGVLGAVSLGRGPAPRRPFSWIATRAALSAVMIAFVPAAALLRLAPPIALIAAVFAGLGFFRRP